MINELIKAAKGGDIEARNQILEGHVHIIGMVMSRLKHVNKDESTKRYGAILGIISAIENFDIKQGEFSPYAYKCALRKAQREMNKDWIVRLPNAKINKYLKDKESPYDIISLSNLTSENYHWHSSINSEGERIIGSVIEELITNDEINDSEVKKILQESLKKLNALERDAIYYMYEYVESTLKETGLKHGVSHEYVRMTTKKAFKKLSRIFFSKIKQRQKQN